jgi:serine protease Do
MIGVQLQPGDISAEDARGLNLPDTRGALVTDVPSGGPAARAGIERGDVIRSVNGRPIIRSSDLPPIIGAMSPGTRVTLGVIRDGRESEVTVTLAPLDEATSGNAPSFEEPREGSAPASSNSLGIIGQNLDAQDRRQLGLNENEGVGIARVQGLAAREAGIRPGDVVLAVGRSNVSSVAELNRELADIIPGDTVMLLVRRNGVTQYFAVTLQKG